MDNKHRELLHQIIWDALYEYNLVAPNWTVEEATELIVAAIDQVVVEISA
jgi:hypothetical protein